MMPKLWANQAISAILANIDSSTEPNLEATAHGQTDAPAQ